MIVNVGVSLTLGFVIVVAKLGNEWRVDMYECQCVSVSRVICTKKS